MRLQPKIIVEAILFLLVRSAVPTALSVPVYATVQVQLTSSVPSPQPLGTTVTWTAAGTTTGSGPLTYRFEVLAPGSSAFSMLRDFSTADTFLWTPNVVEGNYQIRVTARDYYAGQTAQQTVTFQVLSLVVVGQAAVSATAQPLVALFSAPGCSPGSAARVKFQLAGTTLVNYTQWKACQAGSINFYIAGMRPSRTYVMNYQVATRSTVVSGPTPLRFTTGALARLAFPAMTLLVPPAASADLAYKIVLMGYYLQLNNPAFPVAYDLEGRILWYYPVYAQLTRLVAGGTLLLIVDGPGTGTGFWGNVTRQEVLREIDLAGNTVRETNVDRVNEQLTALGTDIIGRFNHEVLRLPNGNTVVLGDVQRVFPAGTQGAADLVDIIGDMIIVLDQNFQVVGYWDAFDHLGPTELDINRAAARGDTCTTPVLGCPPVLLPGFTKANDWLHANSIQYLSPDGSLLVSLRNQDWIVKIDYGNGSGSGDVLWRLGLGGDFAMTGTSDPYPWFSAQHDAAFEGSGPQVLTVFDNGSSRVLQFPGSNSRGQALLVDEVNMVVSLQLNADLGVYSSFFGSAQLLPNGSYQFQPGCITSGSSLYAQSMELDPSGNVLYNLQAQHFSYRAFRLKDLYTAPSGQ